jgi:hypothetical protein
MALDLSAGILAEENWGGNKVAVPSQFFMPNKPAFHAYRDAGHVAAATQIIFNGTRLNNGNHFSTSTGKFTAPVSGPYWFFFWGMDANGSTTYNNQYVRMQRNDSATNELRIYTSTNSTARTQVSGGMVYRMNAGDNMRIFNQNRTSIYGTSYVYCYFTGCYLG